MIADRDGTLSLTGDGEGFVRRFGLAPESLRASRRPLCKACLDWSERRSHLAGALGKALLDRIYALGWARRVEGGRTVAFTAPRPGRVRADVRAEGRGLIRLGGRIAGRVVA